MFCRKALQYRHLSYEIQNGGVIFVLKPGFLASLFHKTLVFTVFHAHFHHEGPFCLNMAKIQTYMILACTQGAVAVPSVKH